MRPLMLIGALLVMFGIAALMFQGFLLYTSQVSPAGPFAIDAQRPYTILLHPILAVAAVVGGIALLLSEGEARAT
jgi:hypothetical protein